jgi:hypothetical protein
VSENIVIAESAVDIQEPTTASFATAVTALATQISGCATDRHDGPGTGLMGQAGLALALFLVARAIAALTTILWTTMHGAQETELHINASADCEPSTNAAPQPRDTGATGSGNKEEPYVHGHDPANEQGNSMLSATFGEKSADGSQLSTVQIRDD